MRNTKAYTKLFILSTIASFLTGLYDVHSTIFHGALIVNIFILIFLIFDINDYKGDEFID